MTETTSEPDRIWRQMREQHEKTERAFADLCEQMIIRLNQVEMVLIHGTMAERAMAADEVRDFRNTLVDMKKGRT